MFNMTEEHKEKYGSHAVNILDSIRSLRSDGDLFDFTIKIDEEVISAHRVILAAGSDYFRAMLAHDTKEAQEGVVEMKGVKAHAIKQCVEYIYTGDFVVTIETVEDVLCAADILQLKKVKDSCFSYLSQTLNNENCVFILKLLKIYHCADLEQKTRKHVKSNFSDVVCMEGFKQLSLFEMEEYITGFPGICEDEKKWTGIASWIEYDREVREQHIARLSKLLRYVKFPSADLLTAVWNEPSFVNCDECKDTLFRRLFSDFADLKRRIRASNCFILKQLSESYEHITVDAKNAIMTFMKLNLDQVMVKKEFLSISSKDFCSLFVASDAEYLTPESTKWNVLVKRVRANIADGNVFQTIVKKIKFNSMPLEFIQDIIRNEPLLKKFEKCQEFLMNAAITHRQVLRTYVLVLLSDNSIRKYDISTQTWSNVKPLPLPESRFKSVVILNDNICFLSSFGLYRLGKSEDWKQKGGNLVQFSAKAKALEFSSRLYVIDENYLAEYDPETNDWKVQSVEHGITEFTVASSEHCIYVMPFNDRFMWRSVTSQNTVKRYDPTTQTWSSFCHVPDITSPHAFVVNSILYAFNGTDLVCYDVVTNQWKEKKTAGSSTWLNLLKINGKIACFSNRGLQIYDHHLNGWTAIDCPNFPNGVVSSCSFQKSEPASIFAVKRPRFGF